MKKKRFKLKLSRILSLLIVIMLIGLLITNKNLLKNEDIKAYVASNQSTVSIYDKELNEVDQIIRGSKIQYLKSSKVIKNKTDVFYRIKGSNNYINKKNIVFNKQDIVQEEKVYVRTPYNLLSKVKDGKILTLVTQGDELIVTGYDEIDKNGVVNMYKVTKDDITGYIYSKYTKLTKEEAVSTEEIKDILAIHSKREVTNGGNAANLDYYPVDKVKFEDNVMPEVVQALYLNGGTFTIKNVDKYIEFAKTTNINAFVVDIKDNAIPAYASNIYKKQSPTSYEEAKNSFQEYQAAIKKIKDNGFYVIGRITVFKDKYYAEDNPSSAIADTRTGKPFYYADTYWPSVYNRDVWKFNVDLAKEAVQEMGFNEIQFDYVRFPDRTKSYETQGIMDLKNTYNEDKAQAVQRFLRYAVDELHKLNVYVSADVFGESAHLYVTAYGQYWAAISNVVDVISAMPYPDHFNAYDYGLTQIAWTVPYNLLYLWSKGYASVRQSEIKTPAIARTWIQCYNTIREPYIVYDASKVSEQIKGLYEGGLTGGYMTWLSSSELSKYQSQKAAYSKEY